MCPSVSSSIRSLPRYLRIALMDFDEIFRKVQFYGNLERDIFGFLKNCFFGQILGKKEQKNEQKNHKTLSRKKITNIFSSKIFTINFFLQNIILTFLKRAPPSFKRPPLISPPPP